MAAPNAFVSIIVIGIFAAITYAKGERLGMTYCTLNNVDTLLLRTLITIECEPMTASVGEELQFTCNIITCVDGGFQWFKVTQSGDLELSNTKRTYTINVTSVMEFGGEMFKCQCRGSSKEICFVVWGEFSPCSFT